MKREEEAAEFLLHRRVDGLIMMPTGAEKKVFDRFRKSGRPVVLIDRRMENGDCDCVLVDNEGAAQNAVKRLMKKGHLASAMASGCWSATVLFLYNSSFSSCVVFMMVSFLLTNSGRGISRSCPPCRIFHCTARMRPLLFAHSGAFAGTGKHPVPCHPANTGCPPAGYPRCQARCGRRLRRWPGHRHTDPRYRLIRLCV